MIIYASKYGSGRAYAHELARRTGMDVYSADDKMPSPAENEPLVLFGSLYAGGLYKAKKLRKAASLTAPENLFIVTCGLCSPKIEKNHQAIEEMVEKTFGAQHNPVCMVRGAMDYEALSKKDAIMMAMFRKMVQKNPDEPEAELFLETYNRKVDLIDFSSLDELEKQLEQHRKWNEQNNANKNGSPH